MQLTDTTAPESPTDEAAATTTTFAEVPLNVIVSSLTNPRKNFDHDKLVELAASIQASGVHQPILLRPLPGSRVQDTFFEVGSLKPRTGPKPTHEIVSGERRYRASQMAGVTTIPAMIRHLTDDQVLEIQMVENLQRDDLSPLEEADGYHHLMQHTGVTAEQVGIKIGKSRSYVYNRLKLLDLGQDGRAAVLEGRIDPTVGMLIARIPDGKLQAKALDDVEGMSFREASHYHRHMIEYSGLDGNDGLWLVAEAFGIDKAVIESQVRANTRAAASAEANPAAAKDPSSPVATPKEGKGGEAKKPTRANKAAPAAQPKITEAEAKSGIAAAMQEDEAAASTAAGEDQGAPGNSMANPDLWPFPKDHV